MAKALLVRLQPSVLSKKLNKNKNFILETFWFFVIFIIMETKKCIKCNEIKSLTEFNKNVGKRDGVGSLCKLCHKEYRRNHYLKNKEKVLKQVENYRLVNPDKYVYTTQLMNRYNKKSGRTIEIKCCKCENKIFATKNEIDSDKKMYCSGMCKKLDNKSSYYSYLKDVRRRSMVKKLDFDLTEHFIKELLEVTQNNKCAVTNCPIKIKNKNEESFLFETASLDRRDNTKGYTKDNVQWVMLGINYMKMDCTVEELYKTLDLIKEYYKKV